MFNKLEGLRVKVLLGKFIDKYKLTEIKWMDLIWFIILPLISVNYAISGAIAKNGVDLSISLDKKIPFISIFIYPYIYWYIYIFIGTIFILLKDRRKYIRTLLAIYIGMCICYIVYYLYAVQIDRPVVVNKGLSNILVNMIYKGDKPVNCFPSLHVLNTYFIMRYTKKEYGKRWYIYTQIIGILIIISTLFIKQHFIVDVISAIILVEIVMIFVNKIGDKSIDKIILLPEKLLNRLKKKDNIQIDLIYNKKINKKN